MTQLRVRARAVDMLGRQQIAGIPTAIHELFKNAHDAYAERVEVDYFRRNRVLVIRDDGYGMTRADVENRWLTLGTESRVGANRNLDETEWRGPKNLPKRSIMGEKGIGRLAIAVIAPITILMTRACRPDGIKNLVVAVVHWGLFEQPGLDVSAIDVPLEEYPSGSLPTKEDIGRLADKVYSNIKSLESQLSEEAYIQLTTDLQQIRVISPDVLDKALNTGIDGEVKEAPLSLAGEGCGTHFIVLPVASELDDDIDAGNDKESSKLERNLLGFSNTMAFDSQVIRTEFRDHTLGGVVQRIGAQEFFVSSDFDRTDQYFEGRFDEYGQFVGKVAVYGDSRDFVCNWLEGSGRKSKCGGFSFRYGYVQGRASESRLSPEDWEAMSGKCDKVGGLYIYRDGIRILPYGNSDVDWIDMERRRNLSAKDWFFSYRRGFGYVAITHEVNGALTEKAGREGFRENQAYRDFRSIIVGLFKQLATEFFKPNATQGEDFWAGKKHYALQAALLKKQKEKADGRRDVFRRELEGFFELYNEGYFEAESAEIISTFGKRLQDISQELDLGDFASRARLMEIEAKQRVKSVYNKAQLNFPKSFALTKKLERDWAAYESISVQLREKILDPLRIEVDDLFRKATDGRIAASERRNMALQDVEREKDTTVREILALRRETADAVDFMQNAVQSVLKEELSGLRINVEKLVDEFAKRSADNPEDIDNLRHEVEQKLSELRAHEVELLESLKRQMIELTEGVKERETLDDRFAALEARNQLLEEQIEFYADFAQMGMSVGILQHEFHNAARGIRTAMSEFKLWADRNPRLELIYKDLRAHIDHLDGYLKVLDPLGRRMHRSTVRISGDEILKVILNVFSESIDSSGIRLEPTFAFRDYVVECKSSAILGAFINIIDNAIYWLNSRASGEKKIILDSDGSGYLISNTGPGIEDRYRDQIFEFGETRKVGGRGMGLAISREALKRENFEIKLIKTGVDVNPVFKISPMDVMD